MRSPKSCCDHAVIDAPVSLVDKAFELFADNDAAVTETGRRRDATPSANVANIEAHRSGTPPKTVRAHLARQTLEHDRSAKVRPDSTNCSWLSTGLLRASTYSNAAATTRTTTKALRR